MPVVTSGEWCGTTRDKVTRAKFLLFILYEDALTPPAILNQKEVDSVFLKNSVLFCWSHLSTTAVALLVSSLLPFNTLHASSHSFSEVAASSPWTLSFLSCPREHPSWFMVKKYIYLCGVGRASIFIPIYRWQVEEEFKILPPRSQDCIYGPHSQLRGLSIVRLLFWAFNLVGVI